MGISLRAALHHRPLHSTRRACRMFMVVFYALLAYVLLEVIGHSSNAFAALFRKTPTPDELRAREIAAQKRRRQMFWEWSLVVLILTFVVVRYWRWFNPF
jgi:hypothetical protein